MNRKLILCAVFFVSALTASCRTPSPTLVGPTSDGYIVTTQQLIRPAGKSIEFHGRPVDLVVSRDGKMTYVKYNAGILVIDNASWKTVQDLKYIGGNGASAYGIVMNPRGDRLYITTAHSHLLEFVAASDGKLSQPRSIDLPAPPKSEMQTYPCGIAISRDGKRAFICLDATDSLAIVDLDSGKIQATIPTGVAPYAVQLSNDESTAYVSNWAGRRPHAGDTTTKSYRSDVVVDDRGLPSTGTISVVDLVEKKEQRQIEAGLHPCDLKLSRDGQTLYVANAASDTVSIIDTRSENVIRTISVRPDANLPFGSMPNALALSADEKTLFAALGGNNAVAVIDISSGKATGFIPAGWYPGGLTIADNRLFIANIKGVGSRDPNSPKKWTSRDYWGSVTSVAIPNAPQLVTYTKQVFADALVPQSLKAWEKARSDASPVPVPQHTGERSVFDHVVYIIKENRTYDQVLGDIGKGNSDPKLCIFGRDISPNHHALADQFVLLDNFYCNGVLSPDGHAWATQGLTIDYLEKEAGAYVRSYPFGGEDAMAISPTGFIWTDALLHGLTFRNYGEMVHTYTPIPSTDLIPLTTQPSRLPSMTNTVGPLALKPYTHPLYPGWNLRIPDSVRLKIFLEEFEQYKQKNQLPNLVVIWLPSDHTRGVTPGVPTPQAMVADNDLALGKIVEAISHSQFWKSTCIFVAEDDPQNGFDHVDGHRSLCLLASPYTKRGKVVSDFYNQCSILRTMELMLGLSPMNQLDSMAPVMSACFTDKADLTPYTAVPNRIPLDQITPAKAKMSENSKHLVDETLAQNFEEPDKANEDVLNRILWAATRGEERYPAEFAGPHGKGLKALHLTLDRDRKDDDD